LKPQDVIKRAIQLEALSKPNEKIIIGNQVLTYAEFASILNGHHNSSSNKRLVKHFMKQALKLYKSNPQFRSKLNELVK